MKLFASLLAGFLFFFLTMPDGRANAGQPSKAGFSVYDLRCQYLRHPLGIGDANPSFGWKLSSAERGIRQAAYQIIVATSPEKLTASPDLWNSGKVMSDQNAFVRYGGKPFGSARKVFWKIKIWAEGKSLPVESASSYFVTGLLQESEWNNAKWIAYEALPDSMRVFPGVHGSGDNLGNKAKKRDIIPYFRREFEVHGGMKEAYVFVCGLGQYTLFVNGRRVDSTFLNPTWSDYTKHCYYNCYDVTGLLRRGGNAIGAIVGNGFLYINRERYRKLVIAAGYPMLRLKMIVRYADGTTAEVHTDRQWKTAPSAVQYSSIYGGEDFDADRVQRGWDRPAFDDRTWKAPVVVPGPGGSMVAQEAYPVVVNETFRPVAVDSSNPLYRVIDFGQNVSGIVRFRARAPKGYMIRIVPGELLGADHAPDQSASGRPYYWQYTFKGGAEEQWQPAFSYYGFRYAGVRVFDAEGRPVPVDKIKLESLISLHTQNGAPQVGTFSCSDTLFNRIFELIRWGIRNNMSNVATDCPHREKLGWLEETHLVGNSMQYNYDILRFYHKIAADIGDAQLTDGLVPDIAPEYVQFVDGFRDSPEWGSAGVLIPWCLYQWYGDTSALRRNFSVMKKYVDYLSGKSTGHLLAYGLGDWFDLGPNRPGVSQLTPLGVTATAFYYYDAKVVSEAARVLGDPATAARYALLADSVREAFNGKYLDPATKVYATGSQTSYAMPLFFGIAPAQDKEKILQNLVDSIKAHDYALTAGEIGFPYLVQTLEENGYNDIIYKMNNRDDVPGYGYQIKKGATALTESWQALRNVSNDHMMLGHLMEWFYAGLAGIRQQPGSIGYKRILIAPEFVKEINWVKCSYGAVNGKIAVNWQRQPDGSVSLRVDIPCNTEAKIVLPVKKVTVAEGDKQAKTVLENGRTAITVGSGTYHFVF